MIYTTLTLTFIQYDNQEVKNLRDVVASLAQQLRDLSSVATNNATDATNRLNVGTSKRTGSTIVETLPERTERTLSPVLENINKRRKLTLMTRSYKKMFRVNYIYIKNYLYIYSCN